MDQDDEAPRPLPKVQTLADLSARMPPPASMPRQKGRGDRGVSTDGTSRPPRAPRSNAGPKNGDSNRTPRPPRQPTAERLWNIALYNIEQRETSTAGLRRILERRVFRYCLTLDGEARAAAQQEGQEAVEATVAKAVERGFIVDSRYAEIKARSWRARGWGERRIAIEMRRQGLDAGLGQDALGAVDAETFDGVDDVCVRSREADWEAAQTLCRRKKIGPYRRAQPTTPEERAKIFRREMGMLARAGFGGDVVVAVLGQPPAQEDGWDSSMDG